MNKNFIKSLTGKLVLAIGGTMLVVGLVFSIIFIRTDHPDTTLQQLFTFGGPFVVFVSVVLVLILYKLVTKPIRMLAEGMAKLSRGNMDYRIELKNDDEIGSLATSFNTMAEELRLYKEKMENWTKSLEEEVQKNTAERLKAHDSLLNAEKLASLGRMSAGVAHELNSPLTGIVTFAHLMLRRIPPENKQDIEDMNIIIEQAERCSKIVRGLLGFSRKTASEKVAVNVNLLIENTLLIMRNQAKFHNIILDMQLDSSLPLLNVDPSQLQQVFVNLLINAADAMEEKGKVTIKSGVYESPAGKFVEIIFSDTGPGISDEIKKRLFEPFLTTKPVGKGTGLGLAVSYGIIKKHGGQIFAESRQGQGAEFFIRLPLGDGDDWHNVP
ncbi:MAG: HAMP domain-containing sensor histidine kinase [Nitrospirae bacterium]|nr:MAG: HAMP domain-containing sensor histidine kinase [Nitrospirota bacterium]